VISIRLKKYQKPHFYVRNERENKREKKTSIINLCIAIRFFGYETDINYYRKSIGKRCLPIELLQIPVQIRSHPFQTTLHTIVLQQTYSLQKQANDKLNNNNICLKHTNSVVTLIDGNFYCQREENAVSWHVVLLHQFGSLFILILLHEPSIE
jgi:hypothetical protein